MSVLASFIPLYVLGFTLNTMSLLGLSLAIGILIDDAIVVRENIVRHIEMGKDHYRASREGTDEIGLAVAATTFSIVAVFVPIGFMSGFAGQWFQPFALTIAASVLVSLFVSFSLDPMLSAYWADPQVEAGEHGNPIGRALERFNGWFDRQAARYRVGIAWALDHRKTMVMLAVLTLVGAVALQVLFGGAGFIPDSDRSEITVQVETAPGSSLEYTRAQAEQIAAQVRTHREVAYTYTSVGSSNGSGAVGDASIYVRLVPKAERERSQSAISEQLRAELRRFGGATAYLLDAGGPGGGQKQLQFQLQGPDADVLGRLAAQVADTIRQVPGAVDVGLSNRGQKPELRLQINRGLAGSLGVSAGQIAQALRPAFGGVDAGNWVDATGETRYVRVRLPPEARTQPSDLEQIPIVLSGAGTIATPGGVAAAGGIGGAGAGPAVVPLGQVADVQPSFGPAQITHLDRHRVITIGANVQGAPLTEVFQRAQQRVDHIDMPPGYEITQGGEVESQQEVFGNIAVALGTAVMLMYLILVVQFGSFLDPARDPALAAAVAHRRGAGAAHHGRHAEHHEPDRRDPAHGDRGEERDPAHRLREVDARGGGDPDSRGADPGRRASGCGRSS